MKPKVIRILTATVLIALTLAVALYFSPPMRTGREASRRMNELRHASNLREIAVACQALLSSTSSSRLLAPVSTDGSVAAVLTAQQPAYISIEPDRRSVTIEFGGGFLHYGYRFEPVESASSAWHLLLYGEEENDVREILRL